MSSGAEDGSPSSRPASSSHEQSAMADEKADRASSVERSPNNNGRATETNARPTKPNAKDPSRPRRKKARRACFACQRAHLTCGDERPCLRCIKRGLQDQCHDGLRKKAKYLHDAPAEALMPGFSGAYHVGGQQPLPNVPQGMAAAQQGTYFTPGSASSYPPLGPLNQAGQMNPSLMDSANAGSLVNDFGNQSDVDAAGRFQAVSGSQVSPTQEMPTVVNPAATVTSAGPSPFDGASFLDASDPSLFNFNISDLNFGNHYGALEFGMLGHISGAVGTPDVDPMNTIQPGGSVPFDSTGKFSNFGFGQNFSSWQQMPGSLSRQNSSGNAWNNQGGGMDAFAIGEHGSIPGQSPHSQTGYNMSPETTFTQPEQHANQELLRQSISHAHQQQHRQHAQFPSAATHEESRKRKRQPSEIYSSVTAPYSYTQGFHALIACLNKRFPQRKVMRIAKALADIRPSFISCNQNLNHDDLIFMEKCFQRTLYEYETFVGRCGTPTIICRRTGEISSVSKEFSLITGWRRDVLLGREPNLNVNTGSSGSGSQTGASSRGQATPRNPNIEVDPGRPQPVFLAELMDEDSVVQFYEDFAELAFGASRTSIIGAPCSLIKYRTKDDQLWHGGDNSSGGKHRPGSAFKNEQPGMRNDGMNALGERDGRVDCSMCWTVKRDPFDIPMFVIMNFLPIL